MSRSKPKTQEQSLKALSEMHESSMLYLKDDEKSIAISNIVGSRIIMLDEIIKRGKVNLKDVSEVQDVTFVYMDNCRKVGILPTFEGLAFSLGYTRRRLYQIIKDGETETAEFLDRMRTLIADVTQVASSKRLVDNAVSIFILKSMTGMGFSDRGEAPEFTALDDSDRLTAEEVRTRYDDLLKE